MRQKLLLMGLIGLGFLIPTKFMAQVPVADFAISQPTACVNSVIGLTDYSSDMPASWAYTVQSMSGTLTVQNPTLSFSMPGSYDITLVATNVNGQSLPVTKNVVINPLPVITVMAPTAVCAGYEATLSASGASTYTWSNGIGNDDTFIPSATANYTVTGMDANSCINSAIQTISVNPLPALSISGSTAVCAGAVITETASGANSYIWSNGTSGNTISEAAAADITYTVTGTLTATGCENTATKHVVVHALPVISVNDGTICAGGIFTITASGAASYTYSSVNNTVMPSSNSSYTVIGKSSDGCIAAASATAGVTVNALPVLSVNSGTICAGKQFTITPTGALSYTFINGSAQVSPLNTTSYSITGTDANGCHAAAAVVSTVEVNPLPVVTVNSGSICIGSVFTILPSGASTFTFANGSATVNPTSNQTYTVQGTDALGCVSAPAISTVSVYALPVITVNSGTICSGNSFTINASGATTYVYSGGSNIVSPTVTTSYFVSGTSAQGCIAAVPASALVTVLPPVVASAGGNTLVCSGESTTLTATGAADFVWMNGSTPSPGSSLVVNPAVTTQYSVVGTTSGCIGFASITVSVNPLPVVTVTTPTMICIGQTATLTSNGAASYLWNSGETTADIVITTLINTTYTVTGTTNSCSASATGTQSVDACLGINELANSFETALYPNPANESFTVKVAQTTSAKMMNALGQLLYAAELPAGETTITLSNQVSGIYFVQLTQSGRTKTLRIIKN